MSNILMQLFGFAITPQIESMGEFIIVLLKQSHQATLCGCIFQIKLFSVSQKSYPPTESSFPVHCC
ncbi:hypothetical protein [Tolypothrix sp. FACHB-123]|uniref:hypothetical protein n=1 Tax=Tolypothrix sp. FACHB-123 TaxID=2692868 RepID=UPI001A7F0F21|nr:hypothetical protein [Tolypothrix sp. FACHB-123]